MHNLTNSNLLFINEGVAVRRSLFLSLCSKVENYFYLYNVNYPQ